MSLPWTAEKCLDASEVGTLVGGDGAVLERETGVVRRVAAALGGDHVVSMGTVGVADEKPAPQEGGPGIAEDEIDGAADPGVQVHLESGVRVEGILVPLNGAPVHQRVVGSRHESDCLQTGWACCVLDRQVLGHEPQPINTYMHARTRSRENY